MNETFWRTVRKLSSVEQVSNRFASHKAQRREGFERAKPEVLNILVAEDSLLQQSLVSLLLKRLGHSVTVVSDGFEAVSIVQFDDFDVILMDCQMPLMNGSGCYALHTRHLRYFKTKTRCDHSRCFFSYSPEECFEAGMDYFLRKPLKMPILEAVLGRLKRNNRQTRQTLEYNLSATCSSD